MTEYLMNSAAFNNHQEIIAFISALMVGSSQMALAIGCLNYEGFRHAYPKIGLCLAVGIIGLFGAALPNTVQKEVLKQYGSTHGVYYSRGEVFTIEKTENPSVSVKGIEFQPLNHTTKLLIGKLNCTLSTKECNEFLIQNKSRHHLSTKERLSVCSKKRQLKK